MGRLGWTVWLGTRQGHHEGLHKRKAGESEGDVTIEAEVMRAHEPRKAGSLEKLEKA